MLREPIRKIAFQAVAFNQVIAEEEITLPNLRKFETRLYKFEEK